MPFPRKSETKTVIGALLWVLGIAALTILLRSNLQGNSVLSRVQSYFGKQTRSVELFSVGYQRIGFGDPVFLQTEDETVRVGNIAFIDFGPGYERFKIGDNETAQVKLYGNAPPLAPGDYVKVHQSGQSMEWVIRTMMPPKTRRKITELITKAWSENEDELVALFMPLIEDSIADAGRIIQEDLQVAVERHREQIDALTQRYQDQLVKKEIVPLVRDEIWPIVQEESLPLADTIGKEIWKEVSVWRFGWRYIYDRTPLPEKNLTEREFNRFVERSAVPILESHIDDFIAVQESTLARISSNEKVKATLSKSVREITNDPEFRELAALIFKEVLLENNRLRDSLTATWKSPKARNAMDRANKKLDPVVTEIGATLFGSTYTAITPEFARVLRNKVLHKDERWLTLHTKASGNRDEKFASKIIEGLKEKGMSTDTGPTRLPMFTAFESEQFPTPAAPPIEEVVARKKKKREAKK